MRDLFTREKKRQTKRYFSYFVELEPTEDHGKGNLLLKRKRANRKDSP